MSQADRTINNVEPLFHPVSHYESPEDVLDDAGLSTDEKRVILSSWASDMYVVESQPTLREIPGIQHRRRLEDILAALKQLDDDTDPPPRGGGHAASSVQQGRMHRLRGFPVRHRGTETLSNNAGLAPAKSFAVDA
jgi:hypothetical protein